MVNRPRPIKRKRRTSAEIERIKKAIYEIAREDNPVTVRQLFYRLVSVGAIEKTEREYKSTVVRLTKELRLAGELPYTWIADNSRWMRKPRSFDGIEDALEQATRLYRRNLWNDQDNRVEIWLEKEALSGVLYQETHAWDVPLMVTRGYPSLTFLWEASQAIDHCGKPTIIYYFGDLDPSGLDIARHVHEQIRSFTLADVAFERVAVTREQVEEMNLQTRPTKGTDTRSKGFDGQSVEVDAIAPSALRELVRECIEQNIDPHQWARAQEIEEAERESAEELRRRWQQLQEDGRP